MKQIFVGRNESNLEPDGSRENPFMTFSDATNSIKGVRLKCNKKRHIQMFKSALYKPEHKIITVLSDSQDNSVFILKSYVSVIGHSEANWE